MENGTTQRGNLTSKLSADLHAIANEAENLIEAQGKDLAERTKEIRDHLSEALDTAQETLATLETQANEGLKATDRAIRKHPYQAVGIALGLGLLAGLLIKRR